MSSTRLAVSNRNFAAQSSFFRQNEAWFSNTLYWRQNGGSLMKTITNKLPAILYAAFIAIPAWLLG